MSGGPAIPPNAAAITPARMKEALAAGGGTGLPPIEAIGRKRTTRIVGRPRCAGVVTVRDQGLDLFERPERPEALVARREAVEAGRPRAVDANGNDGPGELLAADLGKPPPLVGEFGVVAEDPAHVEGDVGDPGLAPAS